MKRFELYVLYLCVVLSAGELLGPDTRKKSEKNEEEEEVSEDSKFSNVDADYFKELKDAMNKEIVTLQEYADALRNTKDVLKDEETNKGAVFMIILFYVGFPVLCRSRIVVIVCLIHIEP